MRIEDISVPEVYKSSADFRFFLKWFGTYLNRLRYDTENLSDIYDPLRCPSWLLWMLADTMGFKYDDRLSPAFNRLVLLYFMSMIRNKGSKDGVTLAAEVNLAQFNIIEYGKENNILNDRLEDTAIPVNSVQVTPHTAEGYIDVVYMSEKEPIDACIEYVRPLGMYLFQMPGVRFNGKSKVIIDARLCNINDIGMSLGPTHVGHYSRKDYASMQKILGDARGSDHTRENVYYRNSDYEETPTPNKSSRYINPGFRTMYSLQLCNNEHISKSLLSEHDEKDRIFGIGYNPQEVDVRYPKNYILPDLEEMVEDGNEIKYVLDDSGEKVTITYPTNITGVSYSYPKDRNGKLKVPNAWNLRYDKATEEKVTMDVYTIENDKSFNILNPRPAVNPVMSKVGDAISVPNANKETDNAKYSQTTESDD